MLEGLFYDAVVLCEADADCRFYAAVRDQLFPEEAGAARRLELLFAQCGGKSRMPVVVRALRAVQVPVIVVADFDLLRVESDVRKTVEGLGGDWEPLAAGRTALAGALESDGKPLRKTPVRDALEGMLDECEEVLTREDVERLRAILKIESGWDKAKRGGLNSVPQGVAYAAAEELLRKLHEIGALVVPVGELERFVPAVGGHGPAWVNDVLAQNLHLQPSSDATAFVTKIEDSARAKSGRMTVVGDGRA